MVGLDKLLLLQLLATCDNRETHSEMNNWNISLIDTLQIGQISIPLGKIDLTATTENTALIESPPVSTI